MLGLIASELMLLIFKVLAFLGWNLSWFGILFSSLPQQQIVRGGATGAASIVGK
jgi:hypothetical protein